MIMAEQLQNQIDIQGPQRSSDSLPYWLAGQRRSRRNTLALLTFLAAGAAAGCGPVFASRPTPTLPKETLTDNTHYALEQEPNGSVIDRQFQQQTGQTIAFSPDPNYANWSIDLNICLTGGDGTYVIYSREVIPNPRDLVNNQYDFANGCQLKHPVIDVHEGEIDEILIGSVITGPNTASQNNAAISGDAMYHNMRKYRLTRHGKILQAEFRGLVTIDPSQIHPNPTPD